MVYLTGVELSVHKVLPDDGGLVPPTSIPVVTLLDATYDISTERFLINVDFDYDGLNHGPINFILMKNDEPMATSTVQYEQYKDGHHTIDVQFPSNLLDPSDVFFYRLSLSAFPELGSYDSNTFTVQHI